MIPRQNFHRAKSSQPQFWKRRGGFTDLARAAKVLPGTLSNILHRRYTASEITARALERASGIPASEWINSRTSRHPAFFGAPRKESRSKCRVSLKTQATFSRSETMTDTFWKPGQKIAVAKEVGMTPQRLSAIIHRTRGVSARTALLLEKATGVPAIEWLTAPISKHAAFYGKPGKAL